MTPDREWKRARLHLVITALIAAVLTGALFVPQNAFAAPAASPAAGAAAASAAPTVAEMTQYVWSAQNQVRYDAGLTTGYARDSRLDKVASDWAYQQWKNGKMSHNPSYSTQIPPGWQRAGENVAGGYSYTQVVPAWKASSSHYANMVNDYTSVGIGYYEANGSRYWSVVFGKYPGTSVPTKPAASTPTPTATPSPKPTTTPAPTPTAPPAPGSYSAEPAAPAGTPIALSSPSFEGGSSGWSGGSGVEGPTTAARGGKYDLKATGGTVSQTVNVAPKVGESYTATIWVKPGGSAKISGSLRLSALGGAAEVATAGFSVSGGWMKVSVPLAIAKAGHTSLRIDVILNAGDIRLDSASLVRTKAAAAAPAPSASPTATPTPSATPTPTPTKPPTSGGLLGGLLGTKPAPSSAPATAPAPAPAAPAPTPAPAAPAAPAPAAPAPAPAAPAPAPAPSSGGLLGGLLGL